MWVVIKNCLLQTLNSIIPRLKALFKESKYLPMEAAVTCICNRCSKNLPIYSVYFAGVFYIGSCRKMDTVRGNLAVSVKDSMRKAGFGCK